MGSLTKTCTGCSAEKSVAEFAPTTRNRTGYAARCRECNATYHRERQRAIRAGTWDRRPHKAPDPTVKPTPIDVAWAAGFIEGEGSITWHTCLRIVCGQKDREALDRLSAFFGGSVTVSENGRAYPIFTWGLYGKRAERLAETIYPFLTERRRVQLAAARARGA